MKYSSALYHILKPLIQLCLKIFFRRIEVEGLEKMPENAPILFTPNHQSAFMDAIVVACLVPQAVHSVTRALVFESPPVAWLLRKLNMMPIYRIRNGIQNLAKNEATFDHCVELLQHQQSVLIFPEGSQNVVKKVRPLSKGFSRIVFRAEQSKDFDLGLQIIPVGINYSQTTQFRGDLYLRFGAPMQVQDLKEMHAEQPQQSMNLLRKNLQTELQKEVLHIGNTPHYETIKFLSTHFYRFFAANASATKAPKSSTELFALQKQSIQNLENFGAQEPAKMQVLAEKVEAYRQKLKVLQLLPEAFEEHSPSTFAEKMKLILLAPIAAYGYFNHYLACKIPQILTYKLFKDPSFFASMKLGFGLLFFIVFYLLQTLLVGIFTQSSTIAALYLGSLIISGTITLQLLQSFQNWRLKRQKQSIQKKKPLDWKEVKDLFDEISGSFNLFTH
ncbi:MAG: 1-acyl-sn-glycerol-3-phosphate acyltransferase [Chitinophagales bacterium]